MHCEHQYFADVVNSYLSTYQRLTLQVVDQFIAELKECVAEAQSNPSGKGNMVAVYGMFPPQPPLPSKRL